MLQSTVKYLTASGRNYHQICQIFCEISEKLEYCTGYDYTRDMQYIQVSEVNDLTHIINNKII